ncbi:MAG: hypothetical protein V4506_13330 [Bacteroidota bacterium]
MKTLIITLALAAISLLSYNRNAEVGKSEKATDATSSVNKTGTKNTPDPQKTHYEIKPLGHVRYLPYRSPYVNYLGAKGGEGC